MYTNLNINSLEGEIWVSIPSYETNYLISNYGRIKSIRYNKIRKQKISQDGYLKIILTLDDKKRTFNVHRLVYFSFNNVDISNLEIDHIDGNRKNNCLSNLKLCTHKQNCNNSITIKRIKDRHFKPLLNKRGKLHPKSKTVYVKNLLTNKIQTFYSTREAAENLNLFQSSVSLSARSSKPVKNYLFSYSPLENI